MNNGHIYLLGLYNETNLYKIGMTRSFDLNKRIKQLQTGNGDEIYLVDSFFTNEPFKMEKYLHTKFAERRCEGEWFYFENKEELKKTFITACNEYQAIINALKNNPYFTKTRIQL